jgi:hypothetical protein
MIGRKKKEKKKSNTTTSLKKHYKTEIIDKIILKVLVNIFDLNYE